MIEMYRTFINISGSALGEIFIRKKRKLNLHLQIELLLHCEQ